MEIVHLPSGWVSYLNELAFFRIPDEHSRALFEQGVRDAQFWHAFESAYWVDAVEQQQLENLAFLLGEMTSGLTSPALDYLLPRAFQVVQLMESIQAGREKAKYARDPLVNDLVLAGVCWLQGQAEERALPERIPRFRAWLGKLEEGYEAVQSSLPDQACEDLSVGFEHVHLALEQLLDRQHTKEALGRLVEAVDLLHILVEWRQQARQSMAQKYQRWFIPLVGPSVQECFEQMKAQNPAQRARLWRSRIDGLWVELSFWWGQQRELLPLPADFLADWIPQVDTDLSELAEWSPGESIDDATLAELTDWVGALAEGFAESRQHMRSVEHLRGGPAGHYYEVIQGLLRNTLPVVAVPALFDGSHPPEAWKVVVEAMLEYTKGGPRELLYEARDSLLQLVPAAAENSSADANFWNCPFCQQRMPVGRTTCTHCGGGASVFLEVRSWNA